MKLDNGLLFCGCELPSFDVWSEIICPPQAAAFAASQETWKTKRSSVSFLTKSRPWTEVVSKKMKRNDSSQVSQFRGNAEIRIQVKMATPIKDYEITSHGSDLKDLREIETGNRAES